MKTNFYIRHVAILLFSVSILSFSCNKKNEITPPIVDTIGLEIDFSQYDLGGLAARSGSIIKDTLFKIANGRRNIVGYKLRKMADYDFWYPTSDWEKLPLINSYMSVKSSGFNLKYYLKQSVSLVPRLYMSTYYPGEYFQDEVSTGSWAELYNFIYSRWNDLGDEPLNQHKDFIYKLHSYEDLKLMFPEEVNIRSLFNIKNFDYPNIKHVGWLYYTERENVTFRSILGDKVFTDDFTVELMKSEEIARVWRMSFGDIAYMVMDAPEESKILVNKLANRSYKISPEEKEKINSLDVYFYLRGYTPAESQKIQQAETVFEKIQHFFDLTINSSQAARFRSSTFGVPLYYKLDYHSELSKTIKSAHFDREINFIQ